MDKIWIRLKDKTSTFWLAEQSVSLVGEIPKEVNKTGFVSKLLKNGVAENVNPEFAKKYFLSKEDKDEANEKEKQVKEMEKQVRIIEDKIKEGNLDLAQQLIAKCDKEFGDIASKMIAILKKELEGRVKELEAEKEQKEEVENLIIKTMEAKVVVKDENGFSIDGKIVAETEEELIGYIMKSKKVRTSLEKKLEKPE